MKYSGKPLIRAQKVTNIIEEQNVLLDNLINNTDKFWHGWAENLPKGKILVGFGGSFTFTIKEDIYLFQRLFIRQYAREGMSEIKESSKELLKELLEMIGVERIYDEDGQYGIFTKKETKENGFISEDSCYCYVNPLIPGGYWENHILETKYVSFN